MLACATCGPSDPGPINASAGEKGEAIAPAEAPRLVIDIFAFARVLGTVAPCGCTTESLGGLQYAFGYIEANSQAQSRLVLEPGSFLFPDPAGPEAPKDEATWAQAEQRAAALQTRFSGLAEHLVSGLGPTDLSSPKSDLALETWPLPRVLANCRSLDGRGVQAHRVVRLGDATWAIDAGVTAVIEPGLAPGLHAEPPAEALRREIAAMREAGVDLTVVLLQGSRATAEALAKEVAGIDLIVVGMPVGLDRTRLGGPPARLGGTWVVEPGEQAQTITHMRLEIAAAAVQQLPAPATWTLVPTAAAQRQELARLDARLTKFRADPSADPDFIARLEQERTTLTASIEQPAPVTGAVAVTVEQSKISCHLGASDADAAAALRKYDDWVATQNQKAIRWCARASAGEGRGQLCRRGAVRRVSRGRGGALGEDAARGRVQDPGRREQAVRPQLRRLPRDRLPRAGRVRGGGERGAAEHPVRAVPRPGEPARRGAREARQGQRDPHGCASGAVSAVPLAGALGHLRLRGVLARRAGSDARPGAACGAR
nr:hypothetical protein [Nannocystis sp.]